MRLRLYLDILKFGLRHVLTYQTEVWFIILTKTIRITSIAFLWSVLLKDPNVKGNFAQILPYFLIADFVQVAVGAEWIRFGRQMINEVKEGAISNYLLRPTNPVTFMYARYYGGRGIEIALALVSLALGWYLLPPQSLLAVFVFIIALAASFVVSFSINVLVGSLSFWFVEADGIKNAVNHVIRIFGGSIIPLTFYPAWLKIIAIASPIPILAYVPASLFQSTSFSAENIIPLISAMIWATLLLPFSFYIFNRGVKHYEAIGI